MRRGANLHPNIPQVQPRSCTGAKNAAPARNREAPDESPATDSAWGGSKKLFGACCTQLRAKVAPITGVGGAIRVRTASRKTHLGRGGCQKLAQQERPQSREHQHGSSSPSQSPDDAGEMGRIPGLPSATGLSFTSRRAAAEWLPLWFQINPSLQAKGLNSDWGTVRGGEGGEEE